jgi:small subunit ribosomal protein S8
MSMADPIADMLTRIRNAVQAGLETVGMPTSKMRQEIARILKQEGFIQDFATDKTAARPELKIYLKYDSGRKPIIRGIRRISKPGLRRYVGADEAPKVVGGMGIAILSTSRGILTDREARATRAGGEVLCYVW